MFISSIYHKPYFNGVYTHFDRFLSSTYKFGTVYTLAYRCFRICSSWTKLHTELVFLDEFFLKTDYSENFVNKWFERFMDNMHVMRRTTLMVEEKPLLLVLSFLG